MTNQQFPVTARPYLASGQGYASVASASVPVKLPLLSVSVWLPHAEHKGHKAFFVTLNRIGSINAGKHM